MIDTFFKGILMGISDIIPGVSGGTIAFILGIYERLINAIKNINFDLVTSLFKKEFKENLKKVDLGFLIPLGIGMVGAVVLASQFVPYLLDNFPAYTFAFFFGLILGSIKLIHKKSKRFKISRFMLGIIGFLIAFFIAGLKGLGASHSYYIIFFSGFIAIAAMLLPGVSGSFILLLLGQYKFMLEVLRGLKIVYIIVFLTGAVCGLLSFSRLLSYLLKKYHSATIWFLLGLMLGALRVPFSNIFFVKELYPELNFIWSSFSIVLVSVIFLIGILFTMLIEKLNKNYIELEL
jgi:putative membrane protein